MYKNVNTLSPFRWIFSGHASHATAIVIDDVIIIGRRRIYCASTLLGRCLCKRVDVYIITLSCTWQIYALSERLLVCWWILCSTKPDMMAYRVILCTAFLFDPFLMFTVVFCSLTVLLLSVAIDWICYGKLVNVYYNFLEFNFLSDLGSFYGTHPWHWYLSQGLVVLLGSHILPLLYAARKCIEPCFLAVIAWTVLIYRFVCSLLYYSIYWRQKTKCY